MEEGSPDIVLEVPDADIPTAVDQAWPAQLRELGVDPVNQEELGLLRRFERSCLTLKFGSSRLCGAKLECQARSFKAAQEAKLLTILPDTQVWQQSPLRCAPGSAHCVTGHTCFETRRSLPHRAGVVRVSGTDNHQ